MKKLLNFLTLAAALGFLVGCEPKPDSSLVLWEQPDPGTAARLHASERPGLLFVFPSRGESMRPYIVPGDGYVIDTLIPFEKLSKGDTVDYIPEEADLKYYPQLPKGGSVVHMCASKNIDGSWVMDGINNAHYENGILSMKKSQYLGKIIQVYTSRKKT